MDAEYDIFEIVVVTRDFWLVDAESYQRRYCTNHGEPLVSGYYVVNWPEHIRARRFNEHAAFHGPFGLRNEAQAALGWMSSERERFLAASSEISSITAPDSSDLEMKKAASQKLCLVSDAKIKLRITGFSTLGYRTAKQMVVR
ncbi:MAG: hypothetical protein Q8N96_08890 [Methylovulum sp.]|nr:hypothetical protein [Methylovulum sp.]